VDATEAESAASPDLGRPTWLIRNKIDLLGGITADAAADVVQADNRASGGADPRTSGPATVNAEPAGTAGAGDHKRTAAAGKHLLDAAAAADCASPDALSVPADCSEADGGTPGAYDCGGSGGSRAATLLKTPDAGDVTSDATTAVHRGQDNQEASRVFNDSSGTDMRPSASYDARGIGESHDTASFESLAAQATGRLGEEDGRASGRRNEENENSYSIECGICAADGRGVDSILSELVRAASANVDEPALITRARHRQALIDARDCLHRALLAEDDDLIAEELRLAGRAFGRLTGRIDVEDVLDVIFRDFCIGK
jgi:hypothetical protein